MIFLDWRTTTQAGHYSGRSGILLSKNNDVSMVTRFPVKHIKNLIMHCLLKSRQKYLFTIHQQQCLCICIQRKFVVCLFVCRLSAQKNNNLLQIVSHASYQFGIITHSYFSQKEQNGNEKFIFGPVLEKAKGYRGRSERKGFGSICWI